MAAALYTQPPAADADLARLREANPGLPATYLHFLRRTNGAEGDLGVEPGWFVVWPAEEAVPASAEYELPVYLPGYFAFGGNGGGELFVFSFPASEEDPPVLMVPAIGMAVEDLRLVAQSFSGFEASMGKEAQ